MSQTQSSRRINWRMKWTLILSFLQKFGAVFLVAAIAAGGYYVSHYLLPGSEHVESESDGEDAATDAKSESVVVLTAEKLQAAGLTTHRVEVRDFQSHKIVPGTIAYDAGNKVELRASVESVVIKCLVGPRQQVKAGDKLLVLAGPEIGQARIAIDKAKANLKLAQTEYEWSKTTNTNLLELIGFLKQEPTVDQVNQVFADKVLGEHRGEILSAYSQFVLAKKTVERGSRPDFQGVVAGRVLDERKSNLEVASAIFQGRTEQSKFQTRQDLTKARSNLEAAKKELAIREERLSALLGPYSDREQAEPVSDELTLSQVGLEGPRRKGGNQLSQFVLTAPRDGQIVELIATQSSRIVAGEVMLVIADTNDVWVEAHIPQRDLPTLELSTGQVVSVSVPGMDDTKFSATVRFSGSTVSPTTLAVPLVAELDNTDQTFRPGMFVWVSVPTGDSKKTITVPVGAVQQGSNAFVFLNEGGGQFRRVDVEIGIESEGWIEIKSGLKPGDQIVDSGAFFLKSELLLESE